MTGSHQEGSPLAWKRDNTGADEGDKPKDGPGGHDGPRDGPKDRPGGRDGPKDRHGGPRDGPRDGPGGTGLRPPKPGRGSGEPGDRPRRCRCGGRGGRSHGRPGPRGEHNAPKKPEQKVWFLPPSFKLSNCQLRLRS